MNLPKTIRRFVICLVGAVVVVTIALGGISIVAWLGSKWPGVTAFGLVCVVLAVFAAYVWGVLTDESDNEGW